MIDALIDITRYVERSTSVTDVAKMLTLHQSIDKVFIIQLTKNGSVWEFSDIIIDEYKRDSAEKYLYRKGPSSGAGTSPAALITEPKKTVKNKLLGWFKDIKKAMKDDLSLEEIDFIVAIGDALSSAKDIIISELDSKLAELGKRTANTLLTIKLVDKNDLLLGEIPAFVKAFKILTERKYYRKYGSEAVGTTACYLCLQNRRVYGFVTDVFPFYTLDKPGFAPNLHVKDAWKLFPVCFECALSLERTKQYIDTHLAFKFYGTTYYVIPIFIRGDQSLVDTTLETLEDHRTKSVKITDLRFTDDEDELWEVMSEQDDSVAFNFLFYRDEKSSMRILKYAEDVLPSRLRQMFEVKGEVEHRGIFVGYSIPLDFSILRTITTIGRDSKDTEEFITITSMILSGRPVDRRVIMRRIVTYMERLRRDKGVSHIIRSSLPSSKGRDPVIQSMMLVEFIEALNGQNIGGSVKMTMESDQKQSREELAQAIFDAHPSFFKTSSQRAAFLLGVIVGRLIAHQHKDRGSAPFEKKLHNLRLDMKRLERIMVQVEEKLMAYQLSIHYRDLLAMISDEFIKARGESVDDDEVSFCFVLGLNQSFRFKSKKGDDTSE